MNPRKRSLPEGPTPPVRPPGRVASFDVRLRNRFPTPPKCLHKLGGFGGNLEERRGIDEDVESGAHQQFDQKSACSRQFSKLPLTGCNSRRLQNSCSSRIKATFERRR